MLADDRYLASNVDDAAIDAFFASGEAHIAELFTNLFTHLSPRLTIQRVLELGCGPGRLVIPFAQRGAHVTAVDVSPEMLRVAEERALKSGVENVKFQTFDEFLRGDEQFDVVNAHLVLQRMPPREGMNIIRELARRVADEGVCVLHVPFRVRQSALTASSRWLRSRIPVVNAAANVLRRKPAHLALMPTYTYDLDEVFAVLDEERLTQHYCVSAQHGDVDGVVIHSRKKATAAAAVSREEVRDESLIDVKQLIAASSLDDLNAKAESYFSSLANWDDHLAKPFARAADTPALLINFANVLQGLRLLPGMTVLDFGGGSGWVSRILTQLGCRAIVLDVSPTALEIAREAYRRQPPIGTQPEPRFLLFDGRRIDLPDRSVDRVICFDAFHHSADPDAMIREFARILVPGGIAGFAEPGPHHSQTAQSQFEMRNYGVVENDVDIDAIGRTARAAGFVDLRVAAFTLEPFHVRADEYEDLVHGRGATPLRWLESTRASLAMVRNFFLIRAGGDALDSRGVDGLSCRIDVVRDGSSFVATATNSGRALWLPSSAGRGGVAIGCHLPDAFDYARVQVDEAVPPGGSVVARFELPANSEPEFDCVAEGVTWFAQLEGGLIVRPPRS